MPKITINKNTGEINESANNATEQILENMRDVIQGTQKPGQPSAPSGAVLLNRSELKPIFEELQKIQAGMASVYQLSRTMKELSNKNKALKPLAEITINNGTEVINIMQNLINTLAKSIKVQN